jgi:thioredoxin 1
MTVLIRTLALAIVLTLGGTTAQAQTQTGKLPPFLNPATFQQNIVNAKGFVILEGWAHWCRACMEALPHLEEFHEKNGHIVPIYLLDFDDYKDLANTVGIERLPTFVLFYNGVAIDKITEVPSFGSLSRWVNRHARRLTGDNVVPDVPRGGKAPTNADAPS